MGFAKSDGMISPTLRKLAISGNIPKICHRAQGVEGFTSVCREQRYTGTSRRSMKSIGNTAVTVCLACSINGTMALWATLDIPEPTADGMMTETRDTAGDGLEGIQLMAQSREDRNAWYG